MTVDIIIVILFVNLKSLVTTGYLIEQTENERLVYAIN